MVSLFGPGYAGPAGGDSAATAERCAAAVGPDEAGPWSGAGDWGCVPRSCGTVADTAHADRARLAGGGRCEGQGAYDVGYQLARERGDAHLGSQFSPVANDAAALHHLPIYIEDAAWVRTGSFTSNTIPSG